MQDHLKSIYLTMVGIGFVISLLVWMGISNSTLPTVGWVMRFAAPALTLVCLAFAIRSFTRTDLVPDYLKQMFGRARFDRGGLSFALDFNAVKGIARLEIYVQNRYDCPCHVTIYVRRAHGMAATTRLREFATVTLHISGGEFGVARLPVAIPVKWQGKRKTFEVNAKVSYPEGRGRLLRFHPGRPVSSPSDVGEPAAVSLMLGGFGTALATNSTGRLRLRYPRDVAAMVAHPIPLDVETLWVPGDEVVNLIEGAVEAVPVDKSQGLAA